MRYEQTGREALISAIFDPRTPAWVRLRIEPLSSEQKTLLQQLPLDNTPGEIARIIRPDLDILREGRVEKFHLKPISTEVFPDIESSIVFMPNEQEHLQRLMKIHWIQESKDTAESIQQARWKILQLLTGSYGGVFKTHDEEMEKRRLSYEYSPLSFQL